MEYIVEGISDYNLENQARIQNFQTIAEINQAFRMIIFDEQEHFRKPTVCYSCIELGHFAVNCKKALDQK